MAAQGTSESVEFFWTGVRADGSKVRNEKIMAASREQVVSALVKEGAYPTKVSSGGGLNLNMTIGGGAAKLNPRKRADFARRMYQMLRAGIPVPKVFESIALEEDDAIADMCRSIAESVSAGSSLSDALAQYPKAFDEVFVAYIDVGEKSGTLLVSLERLTVLLAQRAAMRTKIRGVMAYPVLVGGTILVLTAGILLFLVPRFVDIYASFGADLPGPTLAMVNLSNNLLPITSAGSESAWAAIPIFLFGWAFNPLAVTSFALYFFLAWKAFRKYTADDQRVNVALDRIKYKLPLMGKLLFKSALFRWSSTLAGSLAAGVQSARALEMAAEASASNWIKSLTPDMVEAVRAGRSISSQMAYSPKVFPTNIRTMIATGESTGDLTTMLDSVTDVLQEDIDALVEGLSAKIEVALLLVLGGVVGGMLMILYLPILNLATTASQGLTGG